MELSHAGMFSHASHDAGSPLYGPVEMDNKYGHVLEMPEEVILHIIESYGRAAALAKQYGFGMVTIHGGHGCSSAVLVTPDQHAQGQMGRSFENRMRLPLAVVESIRKSVGKASPSNTV
jgi:2,4-dienoyl-CoA reductase-like NADH-dependent reductase (Old Yellow Enzyme family)